MHCNDLIKKDKINLITEDIEKTLLIDSIDITNTVY